MTWKKGGSKEWDFNPIFSIRPGVISSLLKQGQDARERKEGAIYVSAVSSSDSKSDNGGVVEAEGRQRVRAFCLKVFWKIKGKMDY